MAYQVLARKYRPQRFSEVIGQEHVTRTLLNAIAQQRVAHGYIFSGHRGIGKTTIARILAMALNCRTKEGSAERPTPEPCGFCESCTEIRAGNAVDVLEIDAATNRGIDEIRELRDAARYRPARDRYKIYILDEAHQITDAAFNALLKTLEEPPDHVIFMMATTQPEDIPQTIRSRCQHFSFHAVKFHDIATQLKAIAAAENIAVDENAVDLLAESGDGSMRDALSIMDQAIASAPVTPEGRTSLSAEQIRDLMGSVPNTVFEQMIEAISNGQSSSLLLDANRLVDAGHSPSQLARQFVTYLRNCLMAKIAGSSSDLLQISADEKERAGRSALLFSEEELTRFLQIMLRTFDDLGYRQEQRFHFELGLLKMVHAQRLVPLEQIFSSHTASPAAQKSSVGSGAPQVMRPPTLTSASLTPPTSSPFEADRQRKHSGDSLPREDRPAPPPRAQMGVSQALHTESVLTEGSLALAAAPVPIPEKLLPALELEVSSEHEQALPEAQPQTPEGFRAIVVAALEAAGENTAAHQLNESSWTIVGNTIRIEVALTTKMLEITLSAKARSLAQAAVSKTKQSDSADPWRLEWIASGPTSSESKINGPAASGRRESIPQDQVEKTALGHPLVQKAKELFQAEVRGVVDLRNRNR